MSLMDAILDRPMELVISQLPLTSDCKNALCGGTNALGALLRLAICCERGAWEQLSVFACESGIPEATILEVHRDASRWAGQILQENRRPMKISSRSERPSPAKGIKEDRIG